VSVRIALSFRGGVAAVTGPNDYTRTHKVHLEKRFSSEDFFTVAHKSRR
jgi:hypothetical protein